MENILFLNQNITCKGEGIEVESDGLEVDRESRVGMTLFWVTPATPPQLSGDSPL